jgi:hypothetical protein
MTAGATSQTTTRILCAVGALVALVLAFFMSSDLYMIGFPDGHLTDYDKASLTSKQVLERAQFGFSALFVLMALVPIGARARLVACLVTLGGSIMLAVTYWAGVPWYFLTHLGLDNGVGG